MVFITASPATRGRIVTFSTVIGDSFKAPGEDTLRQMAGLKPAPSDGAFVKPKIRGTGGARPRPQIKPQQKPEPVADEYSQEPVKEPEAKPKPAVKLSNGKWLEPHGKYGHPVEASVDVEIPAESALLTRVIFIVYQLLPDGGRKEWLRFEDIHAKDGKALCSVTVPQPEVEAGQVPEKAYFQFVAKHAHAEEHQGPRLEFVPGGSVTGFESVLYYSPQREEYFHFETREEFETLQEEIKKLEGLQGKSRKALEGEIAVRRKKLEELAKEAENLFDGGTVGDADGLLEELLLVRGNPRWGKAKSWIYIRPYTRKNGTKVKGRRRKEIDKKIKENLEDLLKKAPGNKEASPLLSGDISQKLFEVKPRTGQPLMWYRLEKQGEIAGKSFHFTKEAAVCRFTYGFEGEATANFKERKIRLGTTGNLTYGLLEGSMQGEIPCPENGVNLLEFLHNVKGLDQFLKQNRKCLLRMNVILGAQAFAGLSIGAALSLPHIDLSKEKPGKKKERKVELGGTGSGILGVQASESLAVVPEWSPTHNPPQFEALGQAQVDIGVTVGLAGEARLDIEYKNGTFRFKLGAGAALGIGPRGGVQFDVSLEEGWQLVGHLLNSVDYRYVGEISKDAFEAYKNYVFTLMVEGKAALIDGVALAGEVVGDFKDWLGRLKDQLKDIKKSLSESSIYGATLAKVPPEALGQALITIMQTRDEADFKSILSILYSTVRRDANPKTDPSADHKLKWTIRAASGISDSRDNEAKKEEALRKGIRTIQEFGEARGRWAGLKDQFLNESFMNKFEKLLRENEMHL